MVSIFRNGVSHLLVLVIIAFTSYSTAIAQVDFTNNEGQFIADNPGLAFQDFSAAQATAGTFIFCVSPINQNTDDNCFNPGDILPGIQFNPVPLVFNELSVAGADFVVGNNPANILFTTSFDTEMDIEFSQAIAVGLTLGCLGGVGVCNTTMLVSVFGDNDIPLGSTNVPVTDLTNSFLGITSQGTITRISLETTVAGISSALLNVRFGEKIEIEPQPIPTLSEWGLIAMAGVLGIVGFMVIRRRKVTA